MRIYSASSEETLRARKLVTDWAGDGLLTKNQRDVLEEETVPELRTINEFLRLVLFLFTLIIVGAFAGLVFDVFLSGSSQQTLSIPFLIFAVVSYAAGEIAVSQARLYRYGIEEALAVCSVGFLCVGINHALLSGGLYSPKPDAIQSLVPAAGAVFSLWIWRRFGFLYAFVAAMILGIFLPGYWTSSQTAQHLIVAAFYAAGLAGVAAVRSRHRFDYLDEEYSLVEGLLWLGVYLTINLRLLSLDLPARWSVGIPDTTLLFPRPFYWATWVLIWCLPPIVLARGIRLKDRFIIGVGAIIAILTFISNKPYLGWPRHTWDPMLLGIFLTGVAVFLRRWLTSGPGGIRHGFTAARLSGRDKHWINAGATVTGLLSPGLPATHANTDFRFGGGQTGGGGAGGDF